MDSRLAAMGYEFEPSKYPSFGYSRLRVVISGTPTQRYYDIKTLHVPTFDGRFYHKTQIDRHELESKETFQVCLGELDLETHRGEHLRSFSFGGVLETKIEKGDLYCEFSSDAPIFNLRGEIGTVGGGLIEDELMDYLAEKRTNLSGHDDEMYARLVRYSPYQVFLASLVSLKKHLDEIPMHLRREGYQKAASNIKHMIQVVHTTDGWDGRSPTLDDLLSEGGAFQD